jgi:radical SAM superfamily enzyme YgiQ (UPF0313 family)
MHPENGNQREIFLLSPWVDITYKMAITSLRFIKYYLEDHGYAATIIDCARYPRDLKEVMARIGKTPNPIVGVTGYTRERFYAYELIRKVKQAAPGATLVVGGRHFGAVPRETLENMPEVDAAVRGEGEITFYEMVDALHAGRDFTGVAGVTWRAADGSIVDNPDRCLEDNLDLFRYYDDKNKTDLDPEELLGQTKLGTKHRYFSVTATRGCPNRCVYCTASTSKVRYRTVSKVLDEIEDMIAATGVRNMSFGDSSLTISRKFVTELCEGMLERNLNLSWNCYSRVNIDIDILRLMRRAGLESVEIGLESGSPKVLKSIRKNIKLEEVEAFCKLAHELGIRVWVFCMVSLPDETPEDAQMTIDFVKKIAPFITNTGMQTTRITPDAALCQMAKDRGVLPRDFDWFAPYETPHGTLSRPWDATLPVYLEHLNVEQICDYHEQFKRITSVDLANFASFWRGMKYNLSPRGLRNLTPAEFVRKSRMAGVMFVNALRKSLARR